MSSSEKQQNKESRVQDLIVILDESGSMIDMGNEPIEAINNFITEQQGLLVGDGSTFTLWKFNSRVTQVIDDKNIQEVEKFSDYNPCGMTALFDGVGMPINTKLSKTKSTDVVCLIVTDGLENSSKEYTRDKIASMIRETETKHRWKFIFLGANQDVFKEGSSIGMDKQRCVAFGLNPGDLIKVARHASENISLYRSCTASATPADISLSRAQSVPVYYNDRKVFSRLQPTLRTSPLTTSIRNADPPRLTRQYNI